MYLGIVAILCGIALQILGIYLAIDSYDCRWSSTQSVCESISKYDPCTKITGCDWVGDTNCGDNATQEEGK